MRLHSAGFSPNGKRVRICALELGLPVEEAPLDFANGGNRSPGYLALNPMGKWPTLTDGSFALWESGAIMWYLAAKKRESGLVPSDPQAEADTLRWLFFCSSHIDPYFTALVVERRLKPGRGVQPDDSLAAEAERSLARFIPVLEQQLAGRDYVVGRFGLADIALGCTLELSSVLNVDLGAYPNIRGWLARLVSRESWSRGSSATAPIPTA
jgi:glutathione S-transferase